MPVTLAVDHDLCDHCKQEIETELDDVDDLDYASVDKETDTVEVGDDTAVDEVITAVERAGFSATVKTQ